MIPQSPFTVTPVAESARYVLTIVVALAIGAGAMWWFERQRATVSSVPPPAASEPAGQGAAARDAIPPADTGSENTPGVYISPARQQLIGVRADEVVHRTIGGSIRATGTLAYDETRMSMVHTKIAGWVDRLYVDFVGKPVRRGQALFTIYSPDLVATQREYLLARRAAEQLGASRFSETREGARSLLEASRDRLRLWDVTDEQIAELERTGEPQRTLTVYAPFSGIVLERKAFQGQYVTPEMDVFKLVDLSMIWAIGQFFESDASRLKVGQAVSVEFPNADSVAPMNGRVTFVYPDIDPATRRLRVRVELRNTRTDLKPDTFVNLVVHGGEQSVLAVPTEAVLDSGTKRYVIVAHANGYFEPRAIETGAPVDSFYPVVSGLSHGDRVVMSAQFLVDSESNLAAAMQAMAGMHDMGAMAPGEEMPAKPAKPSPDHSGHKQ